MVLHALKDEVVQVRIRGRQLHQRHPPFPWLPNIVCAATGKDALLFQRFCRQRQIGAEHPPDAVAEVCRVGGAHQRRSQSPEGGAFAHVVGHGGDEGGTGRLVLGEAGALGRQDQLENAGGGRLQEVDLDAEDGVFLVVVGEAALDGHQEGIAAEEQALADGGLQADGQVIHRVALFVKELRCLGGAAQGDSLQSGGVAVLHGLEQQRHQAGGGGVGVGGHEPAAQERLGLAAAGQAARRGPEVFQRLLKRPGPGAVPGQGVGEIGVEKLPGQREVAALLVALVVSGVGHQENPAALQAQDVLPQHPVEEEALLLPAHPDLPAVVIVAQCRRRADVGLGGAAEEVRREEPPPLPHALLLHQKPQLGQVFRRDVEAPAAFFDAFGALLPGVVADAQGAEDALVQKGREALPGEAADQRREDVGVEAVVLKALALLAQAGHGEVGPYPVGPGHGAGLVEEDAGAHGEQVLHRQVLKNPAADRAAFLGEKISHAILRGEEAVVHQKAHRQSGDAFAGGKGVAGELRVPGAEGGLAEDLAAAQKQQAVHPQRGVVPEGLQKGGHLAGGDAAGLRRGPGQRAAVLPGGDGGLLRPEVADGLGGRVGLEQAGDQLHGVVGGGQAHGQSSSLGEKSSTSRSFCPLGSFLMAASRRSAAARSRQGWA